MFLLMVTVVSVDVPEASPPQFENLYPEIGDADKETTVPAVYCPVEQVEELSGLAEMAPDPSGCMDVVSE